MQLVYSYAYDCVWDYSYAYRENMAEYKNIGRFVQSSVRLQDALGSMNPLVVLLKELGPADVGVFLHGYITEVSNT